MTEPLPAITSDEPELDTCIDRMRQHEQSTIWERPQTTSTVKCSISIPIEYDVITVIKAPLQPSEGHTEGNDRKEREIAALFATLTPAQSLILSRRLARASPGDTLTDVFARLVVERRTRLLSRLARGRAIAVTLAQRRTHFGAHEK